MTAEEPKVTETGRYNITETCAILGIHRNTLRRYTEQGQIKAGFRRMNARKFYTGKDILKLWRATL